MGRNAAIKHYDSTPAGQPMELFASEHSRLPAVLELLASPWIERGSVLARSDGAAAPKRMREPVDAEWDEERQRPVAFTRAGRRYFVDVVVQTWSVEKRWWDPRRRISRRFFRVIARGGVYDLALDGTVGSWLLVGVHD